MFDYVSGVLDCMAKKVIAVSRFNVSGVLEYVAKKGIVHLYVTVLLLALLCFIVSCSAIFLYAGVTGCILQGIRHVSTTYPILTLSSVLFFGFGGYKIIPHFMSFFSPSRARLTEETLKKVEKRFENLLSDTFAFNLVCIWEFWRFVFGYHPLTKEIYWHLKNVALSPSVKLTKEACEFLDTLHKYLDCRKQMDAKYYEVDELEVLANFTFPSPQVRRQVPSVETGSNKRQGKWSSKISKIFRKTKRKKVQTTKNGPNISLESTADSEMSQRTRTIHIIPECTSKLQQQSIHGRTVETLAELYSAAEIAKVKYEEFLADLVRKVQETSNEEGDDNNGIEVHIAQLKGKERAQEKAKDDYSKRELGPAVSWLYDIVRGSIKFSSSQQILRCLQVLVEQEGNTVSSIPFRIVKAKNRFHDPTLTGYRDFNICLQFTISSNENNGETAAHSSFQHICELQIHHKAVKSLDTELGSHRYYEFFRFYFAGSTDSLEECLNDLETIGGGSALDLTNLKRIVDTSTDENQLDRLYTLCLDYLCEFQLARRICQRLLLVQENNSSADKIKLAMTYEKMALVSKAQGYSNDSSNWYNKSSASEWSSHTLAARLSFWGVDAWKFNDMAIVLDKQGKWDEAKKMYETALERFEWQTRRSRKQRSAFQ